MRDNAQQNLSFDHLCYVVTVKQGKDAGEKKILHGITGSFASGRLTALMGPSGSGKTSTLDILAGMKLSGKATGSVKLNSVPVKGTTIRQLASYVMQKDVLVPSATVREALVTSALLKLPRSMPTRDKLERVDAIMNHL
eukprot:gene14622-14758_t